MAVLKRVVKTEIIGTLIALGGASVLLLDGDAEIVDDSKKGNELTGYLSATAVAGFFVIYLYQVKRIATKIEWDFSIFCMNAITVPLYSVIGLLVFDDITFSFDTNTGLFGWMRPENLFHSVVLMGLVSGVSVFAAMHLASLYFTPLILSVVTLMMPLVA